MIEGFSPAARGLLLPKKSPGVGALDVGLILELVPGLGAGLEAPANLKTLAVGLGLNSIALTFSRADTAEVGVRTVLDACELGIGRLLAFSAVRMGRGVGTATCMPAL